MAENAGLIAVTVILLLILAFLLYFLARNSGFKRIFCKLLGFESSSYDVEEERSILSNYEQLTNESAAEDFKEPFIRNEKESSMYEKMSHHQNHHTSAKQPTFNFNESKDKGPNIHDAIKPLDLQPGWAKNEDIFDADASRNGSLNVQAWTDFKHALKSPMAQPQFRCIVTQESTENAAAAALEKKQQQTPKSPSKQSSSSSSTPNIASEQLQSPSPSRVASPRGSGEFDSDSMLILDDDKSSRRTSISSIDSTLDEISSLTLTRALSTDSVDSTISMSEYNSESETGQLEVRLQYDSANQYLLVWILQAYDIRCSLGPDNELWVVLFLLPHPKPLWRTKLQKFAPVVSFHEKFRQRVRDQDIKKLACLCQVYSRKSSSASSVPNTSELLGQAKVRLKDIELSIANTLWLTLLPNTADTVFDDNCDDKIGEILFTLNYLPTAERLTVVIAKVRNLREFSADKSKNVITRVYLVQGAKVSRKKTSAKNVVDGSVTFNESMIFSLSQTNVSKVSLRLSVIEMSKNGEQKTLGHVTVGGRRTGKEFGHWQKMIEQPRKPASMWHSLMPKKQP